MSGLGYSTWGMPKTEIAEALPRLARIGYDGVEIAVLPGFTTALENLGPAERTQIRVLLSDHGLGLAALACHSSLLDPDRREASIARLKSALQLAAELSPDRPPPVVTLPGGKPEDWGAVKQRLVDEYSALCEYAAGTGGALALEAHVGGSVDEPHEIQWLMEQIDSPHMRVNLDYSHFHALGLTPEEAMPQLIPYTANAHVKGNRGRWPDHEFLTPGEDDNDHVNYLRVAHDAGYRGFHNVEISMMVQRRPDYDPFAHAELAYLTLADAFQQAGIERRR